MSHPFRVALFAAVAERSTGAEAVGEVFDDPAWAALGNLSVPLQSGGTVVAFGGCGAMTALEADGLDAVLTSGATVTAFRWQAVTGALVATNHGPSQGSIGSAWGWEASLAALGLARPASAAEV